MKIKVSVPATSANVGSGFDALGLAVTLYNTVTFEDSEVLEINTGVPSSKVTLVDGTTVIPLSVDYISTSTAVTPGPVSSVANFNVHYE